MDDQTRTVGVRDLKNNLSAYLREVRQGVRLLVSDRGTVIAELHEPGGSDHDPILREWSASGIVALPDRDKEPLPAPIVRWKDGTASRLLASDRGE